MFLRGTEERRTEAARKRVEICGGEAGAEQETNPDEGDSTRCCLKRTGTKTERQVKKWTSRQKTCTRVNFFLIYFFIFNRCRFSTEIAKQVERIQQ